MTSNSSAAAERFAALLDTELLPAFCHDPRRRFDPAGFRPSSNKVTKHDAANFLRAMESGLLVDAGGGRYRCAGSKAFEQFFWTGPKSTQPRQLTLWMEPVITVATVGRLHLEFGWPADRIGMQSADWAFDFVGYASADHSRMELAGEVKKSQAEVDRLVADLVSHADGHLDAPLSNKARHLNSFRKWEALRRERPALFWAVGPGGYGTVLVLEREGDSPRLHVGTERRLHFSAFL